MRTLTPVICSKARMLRPSRPMMRPFMSSLGQIHRRDHGLAGLLGGHPLDGGDDDRACQPIRLPLCGGLDVAGQRCGGELGLPLRLDDDLRLRLGHRQAGHAFQLSIGLLPLLAQGLTLLAQLGTLRLHPLGSGLEALCVCSHPVLALVKA